MEITYHSCVFTVEGVESAEISGAKCLHVSVRNSVRVKSNNTHVVKKTYRLTVMIDTIRRYPRFSAMLRPRQRKQNIFRVAHV